MSDNLFLTLLKEIVDFRKTYKIENTSTNPRYLEYKKLIATLRSIDYLDNDQFHYLLQSTKCDLDTIYEDNDFADL